MLGSHTFWNKKFKDFSKQGLSRTHFFQGLHSVRKKSLEFMSFLVPPQHGQFYPEVLSVFAAGWIKLAPKFKDFPATTSIFKDLRGLSRWVRTL